MCRCQTKFRTTHQLWIDYLDEVVELIQSGFRDSKEWSDCSKGMEDLLQRCFGVELYLGSLENRVTQQVRLKTHGCVRSWRLVEANGGRCVSEE
jgi:hypothetical protein